MRWFRIFSPGRLVLLVTVIVTAYLTFSAGHNLLNSYRLANDEGRLQRQVDGLQTEFDQLQQVRDYLRSDEYVEYMARRVFGLVKPGENLVIIDAPHAESPESSQSDDEKWWQRLFSR
jgi:cell division protein FtsB